MSESTISDAWPIALDAYAAHLIAIGYHEYTIRTRRRRLEALSLAMPAGTGPWDVTKLQVERWLEAMPAERRVRKDHRIAARAFYSFAIETGMIDASSDPRPDTPATTRRVDSRWADALSAFEVAERAKNRSAETIRRRVRDVKLFSSSMECGPWQVTPEDVQGWVENFDGFHRAASCRDAVRAFYRWAVASKRTQTDPTDQPSHRGTPLSIPDEWEEPIESYRRALQSSGYPDTTIKLRVSQIRRLARENPTLAVTAVSLDDLMEWMGGKRWSLETRRGMYASLRSFFGWAKSTKRIKSNPAKRLPRARGAVHRARPASDDQIGAALETAGHREALAIRLAVELGLRAGEVARVHTSDVISSASGASLVVHGKGGKERELPLSESMRIELTSHAAGYLFPGRIDGHISSAYIAKLVRKHLPEGVTMHALRHAFATNTYAVSNDLMAVRDLLGHLGVSTTQGYVQVPEANLRNLVNAVAR